MELTPCFSGAGMDSGDSAAHVPQGGHCRTPASPRTNSFVVVWHRHTDRISSWGHYDVLTDQRVQIVCTRITL